MALVSGRGSLGMWVPEATLNARRNPSLALHEALKYISWKKNNNIHIKIQAIWKVIWYTYNLQFWKNKGATGIYIFIFYAKKLYVTIN